MLISGPTVQQVPGLPVEDVRATSPVPHPPTVLWCGPSSLAGTPTLEAVGKHSNSNAYLEEIGEAAIYGLWGVLSALGPELFKFKFCKNTGTTNKMHPQAKFSCGQPIVSFGY